MKGSTSMTIFDRFNITVVAAGAGLCSVALALSPQVAAAPLITGGGYACVHTSSGDAVGAAPAAGGAVGAAPAAGGPVGAAPAAGGPVGAAPAGGACGPASAPLSDMAGVPMALPGPVPVAAPVPVGAPVGAPVPVGAPLTVMSGVGGKEQPSGPPPAGAPVSGQPIMPGPAG